MYSEQKSNCTSNIPSSVWTYKRILLVTLLLSCLLVPMLIIPVKAGKPPVNRRWSDHKVEYWIRQGTSNARKLAIQRAANQWTNVKCSCFTPVYKGQSGKAGGHNRDNINLVSICNIDGPGGTLGQTKSWYDDKGVVHESDIHLDSSESWDDTRPCNPGNFDLEAVAKHEFGHLAGLGHSGQAGEIMSPTIAQCNAKNLGPGDEAAIREAYPSRHPNTYKGQNMTFTAPFDLSNLTVPGSVTFELTSPNMTYHVLNLTLPDYLGGGNVTLDFLYGYGEIFFYPNPEEPLAVLSFTITEWVMFYSAFYIPAIGSWSGENVAITDIQSYGYLDLPEGILSMYETGIYENDFTRERGCPIRWWILYLGTLNFTTNVIHLEGMGEAWFQRREDFNADGFVNAKDAILLGTAFGSRPAIGSEPQQPRWNPAADINYDGFINAKDAVRLGSVFGATDFN